MRGYGLFNLSYGTAGLASSVSIGHHECGPVCLWVMTVGALAFLEIAPSRKTLKRLIARVLG